MHGHIPTDNGSKHSLWDLLLSPTVVQECWEGVEASKYKDTFSLAVLWKGNIIRSHSTTSWWIGKPSSCPLSEGNTDTPPSRVLPHPTLYEVFHHSWKRYHHSGPWAGDFSSTKHLSCSSCCHRKHYFIQQNDLENSSAQFSGIEELTISMVKRWTFVHRTLSLSWEQETEGRFFTFHLLWHNWALSRNTRTVQLDSIPLVSMGTTYLEGIPFFLSFFIKGLLYSYLLL